MRGDGVWGMTAKLQVGVTVDGGVRVGLSKARNTGEGKGEGRRGEWAEGGADFLLGGRR